MRWLSSLLGCDAQECLCRPRHAHECNSTPLIAVLKAHPTIAGVLFDLPATISSAQQNLAAANLTERCTLLAGDFFVAVPSAGDAYMLSTVIHDWLDDKATAILQNCHRAMGR